MATPQEYQARILAITDHLNGANSNLTISQSEARSFKQHLSLLQKQLRLIKTEINLEIKQIRLQYRNQYSGAQTTGAVIGIFSGKRGMGRSISSSLKYGAAASRDSKIRPYEDLKLGIDQLILALDGMKLQVDQGFAAAPPIAPKTVYTAPLPSPIPTAPQLPIPVKDVKSQMLEARRLIDEQRYSDARSLLLKINDPQARAWIAKIDFNAAKRKRQRRRKAFLTIGAFVSVISAMILIVLVLALSRNSSQRRSASLVLPTSAAIVQNSTVDAVPTTISTTSPANIPTEIPPAPTTFAFNVSDRSPASLTTFENQLRASFEQSDHIQISQIAVSNTSESRFIIQVQAHVSTSENNTDTVDSLRRIVEESLTAGSFDLLIFMADNTRVVNYLWVGKTQSWSSTTRINAETPIPTDQPVQALTSRSYLVIVAFVSLRTCPRLDCANVGTVIANDVVRVVGEAQGDFVSGSNIWYSVSFRSLQGFIPSADLNLTQAIPPSSTPAPHIPQNDTSARAGVLCVDGTFTYTVSSQGACSHHGGISGNASVIFATSVPIYVAPNSSSVPYVIPYPGTGYVVTCSDGAISHSGGKSGACSHHGGVR